MGSQFAAHLAVQLQKPNGETGSNTETKPLPHDQRVVAFDEGIERGGFDPRGSRARRGRAAHGPRVARCPRPWRLRPTVRRPGMPRACLPGTSSRRTAGCPAWATLERRRPTGPRSGVRVRRSRQTPAPRPDRRQAEGGWRSASWRRVGGSRLGQVLIGSFRCRVPVAANIALDNAGATGGTPGSPTPAGGRPWEGTSSTVVNGTSGIRSIG